LVHELFVDRARALDADEPVHETVISSEVLTSPGFQALAFSVGSTVGRFWRGSAFTFLMSSDRVAWCFLSCAGFVLGVFSETCFSSGVRGEPGGVSGGVGLRSDGKLR